MYEIFDELRKAKGVKIADIQKATGAPYSTFTDWRAGRYTPKFDKLQKIADFFGVTVDYLMTGDVHTLVPSGEYHEDIKEVIRLFADRPDIKKFVEAAADAAPEDVLAALDVLLALKRKGKG